MKSTLYFRCGHERTEANTYTYERPHKTARLCRTCCNLKWKERERNRASLAAVKIERKRTEKYRGQKAGRIVYPGYVYGGTRLG